MSQGLKKEKKWYYIDWHYAPESPARLENQIAANLHRCCLVLTDMGYGDFGLHYLRTLDKKEIDFVLTKGNRPILAVEVKSRKESLSGTLESRDKWFKDSPCAGVQVVDKRNVLRKYSDNTWIVSAERFLCALP